MQPFSPTDKFATTQPRLFYNLLIQIIIRSSEDASQLCYCIFCTTNDLRTCRRHPQNHEPGSSSLDSSCLFFPFEVPPAPRHPAGRDRCGTKFSWVISTTSRTRFWAVGRQTPAPRSGTNGAMTSGRRPSARGVSDFPLPRYIHRSPLSISITVNPPRPGHYGRDAARDHHPPSRRVASYAGRHERPARDEAS